MADDLPLWSSRGIVDEVILFLLGIGLFTLPLWGPSVVPGWPKEHWLTGEPQMLFHLQLLYLVFPKMGERWGALGSVLTPDQRILLFWVEGGVGLFVGWLIYQMADRWLTRLVWLTGAWFIWVGIFYLFAKAMSVG
ncbi:MAG: hypothetical protein NC910_04380 [Candidatus Omnitrophica bacterium]|nr:hypothetical protein [Candidatus Omnitrophota bacterium]